MKKESALYQLMGVRVNGVMNDASKVHNHIPTLIRPPRPFPFNEFIKKVHAPSCLYRHDAK